VIASLAGIGVIAAWFVGAYLCGSIPFGWLIGKMRGVDIRRHGSRNIGATNCGRVCGWPWGVLAFVLDVAKGFGPVLATQAWFVSLVFPLAGTDLAEPGAEWSIVMPVAIVPILGHLFPVWLKFKGGKAVATSLGVLLAIPVLWGIALVALGVWVVAVAASGYVSVASTAAALAFGVVYGCFYRTEALTTLLPVTVFVALIIVLVIVRHRSNYGRLLKGTENRVWGKKPSE